MADTIIPEYPYNYYNIGYVNYHDSGRKIIHLINTLTNERLTISNARYVMSVYQKRLLLDDEEVDHRDDNFLDDSIDNLQILTKVQNIIKQAEKHGKPMAILLCPICFIVFARRPSQTQLSSTQAGKVTCCSMQCRNAFISRYNYIPIEVRHWLSYQQLPFVVREHGNMVYMEKLFSENVEFPYELFSSDRDYSRRS